MLTAFEILSPQSHIFSPYQQVIPDSDAHRAGLQEGDQVLAVNDVDFQDIEHSKVSTASELWRGEKPSRVGKVGQH